MLVKRIRKKVAKHWSKLQSKKSSIVKDVGQTLEDQDDFTARSFVVSSSAVSSAFLTDLADEKIPLSAPSQRFNIPTKAVHSIFLKNHHHSEQSKQTTTSCDHTDPIAVIRSNLPPDPVLLTPFGNRIMTYADYTASGRNLHFIEEYIKQVIMPMYANTHTETSASGLQMTRAREEARKIIMASLHADPTKYSLIWHGTGVTGAIHKLICLLGIYCPPQLQPHLQMDEIEKPVIFISHSEHHSNELMWRESIADVVPVPPDSTGAVDMDRLREKLECYRDRKLKIGSFSSGSNVTGLTTPPGPIASLMHEFGGYCCFDYAGAGPYADIRVDQVLPEDDESYLDAVFLSPHKFVGGPGTPGILCVRKDFANCTGALASPPTIAGGGTVQMVLPEDSSNTADSHRIYDSTLHVREEAGTPGIIESIRCGLVFHTRNLVGVDRIASIEGAYARKAVERLQAKGVWIMGDAYSGIKSEHRLSITSFNIWCKIPGISTNFTSSNGNCEQAAVENGVPSNTLRHSSHGRPLLLHPNFVAALLNDVYGIQARSGCSCAGPLAFRLFGSHFPVLDDGVSELFKSNAGEGKDFLHVIKPGWCRVNFNYFISDEEFDFILSAIEQIAKHGWKLLPLYALDLHSGQYWYNGLGQSQEGELVSFDRLKEVRSIQEVQFNKKNSVTWDELITSESKPMFFSEQEGCDKKIYLKTAKKIYDNAPNLVRRMAFRFRDNRRTDVEIPKVLEPFTYWANGSDVLHFLGITKQDIENIKNSIPLEGYGKITLEL